MNKTSTIITIILILSNRWNTTIAVKAKQGMETTEMILFKTQGDAFCPRLFTLCLNPIAWKLKATEGYKLSQPISLRITDLLFIDDLKVLAASERKLRLLRMAWNVCV